MPPRWGRKSGASGAGSLRAPASSTPEGLFLRPLASAVLCEATGTASRPMKDGRD
jgi:hypothetical protein